MHACVISQGCQRGERSTVLVPAFARVRAHVRVRAQVFCAQVCVRV